eukprot:CAMPEP_0113934950 /NCGR_PEP_ID=MMETSP1339-20121228/2196_1 /TAXON_ID=94617 /ORGANISM="Fibrocapsa japonica" /LENGTH=532 /DNA_ID=CAMNT_0000936933 /DNA_START=89 /DNA_END=1690 /DNA_ORIENTATION=+ /assembly_acc=CAM_ASM_000762
MIRKPKFIFCILGLLVSSYALKWLSEAIENAEFETHFDPFDILQIPSNANVTVVRRAYRRLSRAVHPDKLVGLSRRERAEGERQFTLLAKAYEALTDPVAMQNYFKYGHPDGPQGFSVAFGLPSFLLGEEGRSNQAWIIWAYLVLLVLVVCWAFVCQSMLNRKPKHSEPQLTQADAEYLSHVLGAALSGASVLAQKKEKAIKGDGKGSWGGGLPGTLLAVAAGSPLVFTKGRFGQDKPTREVRKRLVKSGCTIPADLGHPDLPLSREAAYNLVLLYSHFSRGKQGAEADPQSPEGAVTEEMLEDREGVLASLGAILDGLMVISQQRGHVEAALAAVELKAMVRRAVWWSQDWGRGEGQGQGHSQASRALKQQREELGAQGVVVPKVCIVRAVAETLDEDETCPGDVVTLSINVARLHAKAYQGKPPAADAVVARGEPWWIYASLAPARPEGSENAGDEDPSYTPRLAGMRPVLATPLSAGEMSTDLQFQAPAGIGLHNITVYLKSPMFVGVDCSCVTVLRVVEMKEVLDSES